jgi:CRP/FNR family cyclic AMP-dependent transcriptional regulator
MVYLASAAPPTGPLSRMGLRRSADGPLPTDPLPFDESMCWQTIIRLFASGAAGPAVSLPRRQAVYGSLDRDRSVYLIERGQVKAVATSHGGKECLTGIYTAGEVFGELSIVCPRRTEMVTTMTPVVLRRIQAVKALEALSDSTSREEFIRRLVQRLFEQQRLIVDLVTTDSEHRLAAILLYLGGKLGRRDGPLVRIEPRITQEELSAMVGTTRSRVGYFLKRFHDAGLIGRPNGGFLILHEPRIRQFISEC